MRMILKKLNCICILVCICGMMQSIIAQDSENHYLQGYSESVSGTNFGYHSALPDVRNSLIIRAQADFVPIEWITEVVPKSYGGEYVSFIWMYGMDATEQAGIYHLFVNGEQWLSFKNPVLTKLGIRKVEGKHGSSLTFNTTMVDMHEDDMGFATLRLPFTAVQPGEPVRLRIEAEPSGSNAWVMTYQAAIEEKFEISQNNVVIKDGGKLYHSAKIDFVMIGEDTEAVVQIGQTKQKMQLKAGYNQMEVLLPKVEAPTRYVARFQMRNRDPIERAFTMNPVKEWEIYFVQHTHTDAGYTRPQTEILPEHLRFIDYALDYCDQTDHFPEEAQFRWTCETSWSIREYLRSRPQAQIDRLLDRIKEGRIEVTGMFFNFSEIIDESALAAQTKTLRMFQNMGIDVETAMQNDVNGIAWCMVDYFSETDVKYLTMGVHAHRARLPFDKPTAFWWQSPAGNRLLSYRSEHYMHGNSLSLTMGRQDVLMSNLSDYLISLEKKGYPYDKISLQFSGYRTDNSPPSTKVCNIIKEWNEKYEWPKLRSALAKEFMIFLDEEHADEIPKQQVAWPDWWTDGVGSAAIETKVARMTHAEIAASTAILSMAKAQGADLPENINHEIEQVYDQLLFYDEHTHGASESVSDPLAENTINQWGMKSAYAWDAAKRSSAMREKALAFLEPYIEKSAHPMVVVFNTLNWTRSGLVELFIEYELMPESEDFIFFDQNGKEVPFQIFQRRAEGAYYGLWVENIPPLGYQTIQIKKGETKVALKPASPTLENEFYSISVDAKKGVISSIIDRDLGVELVDQNAIYSFGDVIYEQLENRHDLERLTASLRDTVYRPLNEKRTKLSNVQIIKMENGPVFQSLFVHGDLPVCADERGVEIEIRLYHNDKKIELLYGMHKLPVHNPEGVYVSFPFELKNGKLAFEAQGGVVYPGRNQLAGSASDWNTVQNFASVRNDKSQIIFGSKEIPLVQFGDLNIGRYYYRLKPKTNHMYSWVMNNYWVTNFKSSQRGELKWSYFITSTNNPSDITATRFGWGSRAPLYARILPAGDTNDQNLTHSKTIFPISVPNLLVVNTSLSMDGKGIVLHLREIEGDHAIVDVNMLMKETGARSIQEVNVLEEELATLTAPLLIEHFETKFLKLNFE